MTWLFTDTLSGKPESAELIKLWIFGDGLVCEGFQNLCLDKLRERQVQGELITADLLLSVYNSQPDTSPLLRYCTAQAAVEIRDANNWTKFWFSSSWSQLSADTMRVLMTNYKARENEINNSGSVRFKPAEVGGCRFHVHRDGGMEECSKKKEVPPTTTNSAPNGKVEPTAPSTPAGIAATMPSQNPSHLRYHRSRERHHLWLTSYLY